jgi:hypothetical protein
MWADLNLMRRNCPEQIVEEVNEIMCLSRKFINKVDIDPYTNFDDIKVDLQDARDYLLRMIGKLITTIANNYEEDDDKLKELGIKLKFEEDVGSVLNYLRDCYPSTTFDVKNFTGIMQYLKFAGELRSTWDFLIYSPITIANKRCERDIKSYIPMIFLMVRCNAGILGKSAKLSIPSSRQIIPAPINILRHTAIKESTQKEMLVDIPPELLEKPREEDAFNYHENEEF